MKKIKLTIAGLLLAGFSYSQAQDTICYMVAGKQIIEFDYYESKLIKRNISSSIEDVEFKLNTKDFLVLDLYDNCECVKEKNFHKKRNITVYYKNGNIGYYANKSGDDILYFDGLKIDKVEIKKPKLLEKINLSLLKPYKN